MDAALAPDAASHPGVKVWNLHPRISFTSDRFTSAGWRAFGASSRFSRPVFLPDLDRPAQPRQNRAMPPDFSHETAARDRGLLRICGVDEVGRGPLAGPVTAAAVILDPECIPDGLDDSKRLTPRRRAALAIEIARTAEVSIAHASVAEIEEHNILRAAHLAMIRAIARLPAPPCHVLIDGNMVPRGLNHPCETLVGGDGRSLSIAAASIVAKVERDRIMASLAEAHPGYGWERNAGYGTAQHKAALQDLGVTRHHRRKFKPIHNILYQGAIATD